MGAFRAGSVVQVQEMLIDVEGTIENEPAAVVEGVIRILDYAMIEGAQLRLPLFVLLLQLARRELLEPTCIDRHQGATRKDVGQSSVLVSAIDRMRLARKTTSKV
jgi:hypothetical protein